MPVNLREELSSDNYFQTTIGTQQTLCYNANLTKFAYILIYSFHLIEEKLT